MIRSAVTVDRSPRFRRAVRFLGRSPRRSDIGEGPRLDAIESPPAATPVDRNPAEALDDTGLSLPQSAPGAGWVKHRLHLTSRTRRPARQAFISRSSFRGPARAPAIIGSMQGRHEARSTPPPLASIFATRSATSRATRSSTACRSSTNR